MSALSTRAPSSPSPRRRPGRPSSAPSRSAWATSSRSPSRPRSTAKRSPTARSPRPPSSGSTPRKRSPPSTRRARSSSPAKSSCTTRTATASRPRPSTGTCGSSDKAFRRQPPRRPEGREDEEGGDEEGELQRLQLRVFVVGDELVGRFRRHPGGFGCFTHLGGGDEAAAGAELHLDLLFDPAGDLRVVGDVGGEGGCQAGDRNRAEQRRAERGAELLGGVLEAAGFAALLVVDRRLHDVAELGNDQAHADAEHAHRDQEGG